jgi:hypothetical protein
VAFRSHRNPADGHPDLVFYELEVTTGWSGEVLVAANRGDFGSPPPESLEYRFTVVEDGLLAGKLPVFVVA